MPADTTAQAARQVSERELTPVPRDELRQRQVGRIDAMRAGRLDRPADVQFGERSDEHPASHRRPIAHGIPASHGLILRSTPRGRPRSTMRPEALYVGALYPDPDRSSRAVFQASRGRVARELEHRAVTVGPGRAVVGSERHGDLLQWGLVAFFANGILRRTARSVPRSRRSKPARRGAVSGSAASAAFCRRPRRGAARSRAH